MSPAGFESAIPVGKRPQTHDLDRSATGIDITVSIGWNNAGQKSHGKHKFKNKPNTVKPLSVVPKCHFPATIIHFF
jgi:hypothetical protein